MLKDFGNIVKRNNGLNYQNIIMFGKMGSTKMLVRIETDNSVSSYLCFSYAVVIDLHLITPCFSFLVHITSVMLILF